MILIWEEGKEMNAISIRNFEALERETELEKWDS